MTVRRFLFSTVIVILSAVLRSAASAEAILETDDLRLVVDTNGAIKSLLDRGQGMEYAAGDQECALLRVRSDGRSEIPSEMLWDARQGTMRLIYDGIRVEALVKVTAKPTHVSLELVSIDPLEKVDAVQWGPLPTTIRKTVGEIVGVVRNEQYAIGLQGLNVKTLGGVFLNEEGRDTSRGRTAKPTDWGSTLQAYSLDRSRPRKVSVWGGHFPNMPVPPIEGETVLGSKIALFGCAADRALKRVGEIEIAEGLPHPEFDGVWAKLSPECGRSYMIGSFSEKSVDKWLDYVKRANLACLYHSGPFKSWGHYELNPRLFPNGVDGMKTCVEKARKLGIRIGVHTLTNFINTNDAYVTPVPDPRLAKTGSSRLTAPIKDDDSEIPVASPEYFANTKANWLRTIVIGEELIRYGGVSEREPWRLLDCQRGAFGTRAAKHAQGDEVAKLMDHPYKVFLADYELQQEIAVRLAELFNATGISHLDFDGHEGCWASGQGDFAIGIFAKVFYDHLDRPAFNGSSISQPSFYWHINTAVNWGEPWGAGFREGMPDYRFNNQALLERNYMPNMLGWFSMRSETTLADVEWMLARCAGYNAGFAFATDLNAIRKNPQAGAILDAIRVWEKARYSGVFTDEHRERLKVPSREYHLEYAGDSEWRLYPFNRSEPFVYEEYIRQPGEPTPAGWEYVNPDEKQPLQFYLEVEGEEGSVRNITLEFDSYIQVAVQAEIEVGQRLVCDGARAVRVYGGKGLQRKTVDLARDLPHIARGPHHVELSADFVGNPPPKLVLRIKTQGKPETLAAAR